MKPSTREPQFLYSEEQAAEKSVIAKAFVDRRKKQNMAVTAADNNFVNRFFNLDHNAYLEGVVPSKYKELMGLAASAVLRCDDCIFYHIIQSYRLGISKTEQEESLNVGLIVGGSIVIPHLRRAYELLSELYGS